MSNNLKNVNETNATQNKAKKFWKNFGLFILALLLSVVTVFVISLN